MFTNPFKLRDIFLTEQDIVDELKSSIYAKQPFVTKYLEVLLKPVNDEIEAGRSQNQDLETITWERLCANPIHVFSLMGRKLYFEDVVLQTILRETENLEERERVLNATWGHMKRVSWPEEIDFKGAIHGLLRVQFTYHLPTIDIADGKLRDRQTLARLSVDDCLFLAKDRLNGKNPLLTTGGIDFAVAIEWAEAALELEKRELVNTGKEDLSMLTKISEVLNEAKKSHDKHFMPPTPGDGWSRYPNEHFFIRPFGEDKQLTGRQLRQEERENFSKRYTSESLEFVHHLRDYHTLCRGDAVLSRNAKKFEGYCTMTHKNDPYLYLSPAKIEVLSEQPELYMFHDVVTKNELEYMQTTVTSKLSRSGLYVEGGAENSKFTSERTQSNAWLFEAKNTKLHALSRRLEHLTGLHISDPPGGYEMEASEAYQIGVYSPGGLYLPHYDALEPLDHLGYTHKRAWVGNRIATAMFYLSDVDGGGTAFGNMGKVTFPKKGSLAFWYNLHRNGSKDFYSIHGACPTLFGIKWVSNKWIREGMQFNKRPCSLDPML